LVSPDRREGERFGMAVATLGDDILSGAPCTQVTGFFQPQGQQRGPGAVYRFRFNGRSWESTTYDSPSGTIDAFGQSLATPGGLLLVGAPHDGPLDTGAAYLIDPSTKAVLHTFRSPTACTRTDSCQQLGGAVAALGTDALVGSWFDEAAGKDAGAAYLFRSGSGLRARDYLADTPVAGDEFGLSVAAVNGLVAIGADKATSSDGTRGGAVFVFDAPRCGDGTVDPDEQCDAGASLPTPCCAADCTVVPSSRNKRCGDQSQGPCDDPDTCDTQGRCLANPKPARFACPDDGNECTQDQCDDAGQCTHPPQPTRFPCSDDGNVCTGDYCDGRGACVPDLTEKDGMSCDNGDPVCLGDTCQDGVCANYRPCQIRLDETVATQDPRIPAAVLLTCAAGLSGKGNFCAVESATVDLTQAGLAVPASLDRAGGVVLAAKAIRPVLAAKAIRTSRGRPKQFRLDPLSGTTTRTLRLNPLGRKLLSQASSQGKGLPVTLDVVVVVNQEPTRLRLLVNLLKRLR
jgi:cysteine-rich repeat protein